MTPGLLYQTVTGTFLVINLDTFLNYIEVIRVFMKSLVSRIWEPSLLWCSQLLRLVLASVGCVHVISACSYQFIIQNYWILDNFSFEL